MSDEVPADQFGAERVRAYTHFLESTDVPQLAAAIAVTWDDLETLRQEGRRRAARGAASVMGELVRRLCYILPTSDDEAVLKLETLEGFAAEYAEGGQPLMAAMIGAALASERERLSDDR